MKKVFSLLAVLALVCMATSAWADVSIQKSSVADFSTQGEISLNFVLKYIDTNNTDTPSGIEWNVSAIPLNQAAEAWTTSTVYAEISATVTKANGAIYMYQNNTDNNSVYKSTAPRHDGSKTVYSGLVNTTTKGGDYRGFVPLAYQITKTKATGTPSFGTSASSLALQDSRFFKDHADSDFSTSTNYITIANLGGLVGGTTETDCYNIGSTTGYMYFGGWFDNIYGGDVWGTDRIKIVSTIE